MTPTKRTILLHDDNWGDHLPGDYPRKLVEGLAVGPDGIRPDDKIVTRLLAWVGRESGRSPDMRYETSRHNAAVLLEQLAGWPED